VIHTAAYVNFRRDKLTQFTGANTIGAVEMYRAAREAGVKRFVHISTIAAVGGRKRNGDHKLIKQSGWIRSKDGHIDESWEFNLAHLRIPYVMTKHAAEVELMRESSEGGPELVVVNPSIIVAPSRTGDDRSRAMKTFSRWFMPSFGNMMNLVDIRDVAFGVLAALEKGRAGERYLLTGDNISARDLVLTVSAVLRKAPQLIGLRRWFLDLAARGSVTWRTLTGASKISFYPDLVKMLDYDWVYTCRKAREELGYNPRPILTTLDDLLTNDFGGSYAKP
jgi:dihydroflavonol-4-reductase